LDMVVMQRHHKWAKYPNSPDTSGDRWKTTHRYLWSNDNWRSLLYSFFIYIYSVWPSLNGSWRVTDITIGSREGNQKYYPHLAQNNYTSKFNNTS
jgi:hypothetical protein